MPLSRPGGAMVVPDLTNLADMLRDVAFQYGERGKVRRFCYDVISPYQIQATNKYARANTSRW